MSAPLARGVSGAAGAAGGPLNSALGQWAVLGLAAYAIAGKENAADFVREAARLALRLSGTDPPQQEAVVVRTESRGAASRGWWWPAILSALRVALGAGVCCASYAVLSPELRPVVGRALESALSSVGRSVLGAGEAVVHGIGAMGEGGSRLRRQRRRIEGRQQQEQRGREEPEGTESPVSRALFPQWPQGQYCQQQRQQQQQQQQQHQQQQQQSDSLWQQPSPARTLFLYQPPDLQWQLQGDVADTDPESSRPPTPESQQFDPERTPPALRLPDPAQIPLDVGGGAGTGGVGMGPEAAPLDNLDDVRALLRTVGVAGSGRAGGDPNKGASA